MITFHWFTYGGDAAMLPKSLESVRRVIPEARLVVVDDGENPSSEATRAVCEYLGAEWRVSDWPRGGNLRGPGCIDGILGELARSAEDGAEVVAKVDPDTLVLSREWLDNFWDAPAGLTAADNRGAMYGCCYAMGVEQAVGLRNSFLKFPAYRGACEDIVIAERFKMAYGEELFLRIPMWTPEPDEYGNGPDGVFTAWDWERPETPERLCRAATRFQILNCGLRTPATGNKAELMGELLKVAERAKV